MSFSPVVKIDCQDECQVVHEDRAIELQRLWRARELFQDIFNKLYQDENGYTSPANEIIRETSIRDALIISKNHFKI